MNTLEYSQLIRNIKKDLTYNQLIFLIADVTEELIQREEK